MNKVVYMYNVLYTLSAHWELCFGLMEKNKHRRRPFLLSSESALPPTPTDRQQGQMTSTSPSFFSFSLSSPGGRDFSFISRGGGGILESIPVYDRPKMRVLFIYSFLMFWLSTVNSKHVQHSVSENWAGPENDARRKCKWRIYAGERQAKPSGRKNKVGLRVLHIVIKMPPCTLFVHCKMYSMWNTYH